MEIEFLDDPHSYRDKATRIILPSVTEIIGAVLRKSRFDRIDPEIMERARERGKLCHAAIHMLDEEDRKSVV